MPSEPESFLKAVAESTRLRIVMLLHHCGELCVCDLHTVLKLSQPKISRHLKVLRDEMVVKGRRDGLWIHYSLHPNLPDWAVAVIADLENGCQNMKPYATDLKKINKALANKGCAA